MLLVAAGAYQITTAAGPAGGTWVEPATPSAGPTGPGVATPSPALSGATPSPSRTAVAGTGIAPFVFGTLETLPDRAGEEARRGVKVAMMELSWAAYEPGEGQFDGGYARQARQRLATLRGQGMRVTLGLGLHYAPDWALGLPDSRFVDQRGRVSGELNLVFNQALQVRA